MRILVLFFLFLSSFPVFASQCCFCEIGNYPVNERGWYKNGCQLWLSSQKNCTTKEIVDQNTHYASKDLKCNQIVLGYVGHWENSYETVTYLNNIIAPLMERHPASVFIDNTACSAMKDPELVLNKIQQIKRSQNQKLIVRGNQVISIGKWDTLFGKGYNFWAQVQTDKSEVIYPQCKDFDGYNCWTPDQINEQGLCVAGKKMRTLKCCPVRDWNSEPYTEKHIWSDPSECLR
jgi:hypothetical protein